jgi:hypothetical protein
VLTRLENKTTREAHKLVRTISPAMRKHSVLDFNSIEDDLLREKLLRIKGLYAHSHPNIGLSELLHILCDLEIVRAQKAPSAPKVNSRANIKREVWHRDEYKCSNCDSTYALEIDHITPRAAGGSCAADNLRVLCRNCNQRAAIEYFGTSKMQQFFS